MQRVAVTRTSRCLGLTTTTVFRGVAEPDWGDGTGPAYSGMTCREALAVWASKKRMAGGCDMAARLYIGQRRVLRPVSDAFCDEWDALGQLLQGGNIITQVELETE